MIAPDAPGELLQAHRSFPRVAIAGGGIVGLATAAALLEMGIPVVVLEAEDRLAAHQTGHNSGVIHSGLYYRPGSLKARLCREGRDALYRFCAAEGVAHRRTGKLVVATRPEELPALGELETRGRANGLDGAGLRRLDPYELRALEPAVAGIAGLWVAETGVVDFAAVARALAGAVARAGGEIRTGTRVLGTRADGAALAVATTQGDLRVALLVNCAGLYADRLARACGVEPGVMIVPFRGEYYELAAGRGDLIRHLVYPVPDPALPFLGVHFTRRIDGRVEAGPNAVLAWKREGYRRTDVSARDLGEMLAFGGFWRMAARHWRSGARELGRSLSRRLFVRALRRLVPDLRDDDVVPAAAAGGVRAQAVDGAGRLLDDFHIVQGARSIHVVNAPSPAATAALSIGRHIAGLARARLDA